MRDWLAEVARATAKYLAWVAGGAALGALVDGLIWGAWLLGALGVGCVVALVALPSRLL